MSENLKQFKTVLVEALVTYFKDEYDKLTSRMVSDAKTGAPVRTYGDEDLSCMTGEITLVEAWEQGGVTFAMFKSTKDGKVFDFTYRADTSLMNIVMATVLAS